MEQEVMEMQLWEYLDGTCSRADRERIALLIASDAVWRGKYEELSFFHAGIANSMELEQPSMRFAKNVMDAVAATHVVPATKKYINKSIIKGISALFIIMLAAMLGYAFATTQWGTSVSFYDRMGLKGFDMGAVFNSPYLYAFLMVNIALVLILADGVWRRKRGRA